MNQFYHQKEITIIVPKRQETLMFLLQIPFNTQYTYPRYLSTVSNPWNFENMCFSIYQRKSVLNLLYNRM